jgi:hypothetical protein
MRRVLERWRDRHSTLGKAFRSNLGAGTNLYETGWTQARLAYHGVEQRERNDVLEAANLARRMRERLTNRLSRNPGVTARALQLYDPNLPAQLKQEWSALNDSTAVADEESDESNAAETQSEADGAL